jgi:hypothetical protein
MRYIFLCLNPACGYEYKVLTRNLPLDYLFEYLYSREQDERLRFEEDTNDPTRIILWAEDNIKKSLMPEDFNAHQDFTRQKDFLAYCKQFGKYGMKRFAEMPAIRISRENYEQLKQQFEGLYKRKHKYLIMREHDDGHVDMLEKDEWSEQDIVNMNREHKIYQNYIKRLEAYQKAYPNRSYIWRSPADNEFESNFALYDPADEQDVD